MDDVRLERDSRSLREMTLGEVDREVTYTRVRDDRTRFDRGYRRPREEAESEGHQTTMANRTESEPDDD